MSEAKLSGDPGSIPLVNLPEVGFINISLAANGQKRIYPPTWPTGA